ncbi:MAG: hypothetical protein ACTSRG_26600 [Candidatus Helarchaeota archaeon]
MEKSVRSVRGGDDIGDSIANFSDYENKKISNQKGLAYKTKMLALMCVLPFVASACGHLNERDIAGAMMQMSARSSKTRLSYDQRVGANLVGSLLRNAGEREYEKENKNIRYNYNLKKREILREMKIKIKQIERLFMEGYLSEDERKKEKLKIELETMRILGKISQDEYNNCINALKKGESWILNIANREQFY